MTAKPAYFAQEAGRNLKRNLLMVLASIFAVAISLALVGSVMLLSRIVENVTERWEHGVAINAFLRDDASEADISGDRSTLQAMPEVKTIKFVSKKDAYDEFVKLFKNQPQLVENVDAQTLPASFRVSLHNPKTISAVSEQIKRLAGIDEVVSARDEVKKDPVTPLGGLWRDSDRSPHPLSRSDRPHLQHGPAGHFCPAPRDFDNETCWCNELVHPLAVHARGPRARCVGISGCHCAGSGDAKVLARRGLGTVALLAPRHSNRLALLHIFRNSCRRHSRRSRRNDAIFAPPSQSLKAHRKPHDTPEWFQNHTRRGLDWIFTRLTQSDQRWQRRNPNQRKRRPTHPLRVAKSFRPIGAPATTTKFSKRSKPA